MKHVLNYSKTEFVALQGKVIGLQYKSGDKLTFVTGRIGQIYLASNPPNEVGSFDFTLSEDSWYEMQNAGIKFPLNLSVLEVEGIEDKLTYKS